MNKYFIEFKVNNNKFLSDIQNNVNISLNEMMNKIQDLKFEFSKDIEILKRT